MGIFGNGITTNKNIGVNTICCMTTSGVWTCPVGAVQVEFYVVGAGGGGGGSGRQCTVSSFTSGGGGGGGGGVSLCVKNYSAGIPSSAAVVIGTGGTGGVGGSLASSWIGGNGNNGGFTCVNSIVCAPGGGGGGGGTMQNSAFACGLAGPGGVGNLRTGGTGGLARFFANSSVPNMTSDPGLGGGTIGPAGGGGGAGFGSSGGVTCCGFPGNGGSGQPAYGFTLGAGGNGSCVNVTGSAGTVYGAGGGGGGSCTSCPTQDGRPGGNGASGLAYIISYF